MIFLLACTKDDQCKSGKCIALVCTECWDINDCTSDEYCFIGKGCVAKHENTELCIEHDNCKSGKYSLGTCTECWNIFDCLSGEFCLLSKTCVKKWDNGVLYPVPKMINANQGKKTSVLCTKRLTIRDCNPKVEYCIIGIRCVAKHDNGELCLENNNCKSGKCS